MNTCNITTCNIPIRKIILDFQKLIILSLVKKCELVAHLVKFPKKVPPIQIFVEAKMVEHHLKVMVEDDMENHDEHHQQEENQSHCSVQGNPKGRGNHEGNGGNHQG